MLLAKVGEHVSVVTEDVATEDLDVVLETELVHAYHQISGAAGQTHLRGTREGRTKSERAAKTPTPMVLSTLHDQKYVDTCSSNISFQNH